MIAHVLRALFLNLLLFTALLLAGCEQQARIEAKDTVSFERSYERVVMRLTPPKKQQLERALKGILFADIKNLNDLLEQDEDKMRDVFYKRIDEKTADQIIAFAYQLRQ